MTVRELREMYFRFFESKGHAIHPSGSLIPYDVTGKLDESLLFNGAGMVQFKPYFRGTAIPPVKRLVTVQKCVRTGDIDEVGDLTHLTFFEMLGNFSFGDYFKADAIEFSWEFMTSPNWLALDPSRISVTVFEEDDEAYSNWSKWFQAAGINPSARIIRLGEDANYWPAGAFSNGPPGPCGPNTEMFYWVDNSTAAPIEYSREQWIKDEAAGKWLEFWNDVFIQSEWQGRLKNPDKPSEGYAKVGMPDLPFQSVDTGMGLERSVTVLSGLQSLYDTDVFQPIIRSIERLSGEKIAYGQNQSVDAAVRIIADHVRTASFCIADGILPSNTGRGYVLRRIIRRAILKGDRVLGFDFPFFHHVAEGVRESMGDYYSELSERKETIQETLRNEETLFRRTLHTGMHLLQQELDALEEKGEKILDGNTAFFLYDTYGFPLEVTREILEEVDLQVDLDAYESALKIAQARSRGADGMATVYAEEEALVLAVSPHAKPVTIFLGYGSTEAQAEVSQVSPRFGVDGLTTGQFQICLDQTPFFAESGGQVGDTGLVTSESFRFEVVKTWRELDLIWHDVILRESTAGSCAGMDRDAITRLLESGFFFQRVTAQVDSDRRRKIMRNHTATHLLHAALRSVLGTHVTQAGSLVAPEHLRFDFTHNSSVSPEDLAEIEQRVNTAALSGLPVVIHENVPLEQAKKMGAMALFGEKYGDRVRVVEVAPLSMELCGGIHVERASDIGLFKIVQEVSAASGIRRIVATTGEGSYELVREQAELLHEASQKLKTSPRELLEALQKSLDQQKELTRKLKRLREQGTSASEVEVTPVGPVELAVHLLEGCDQDEAVRVADKIADGFKSRVTLVAADVEGKALFVAKSGSEALAAGAHAGQFVKALAAITGGGGGGRADFATAGGRDVSKISDALREAPRILAGQLN